MSGRVEWEGEIQILLGENDLDYRIKMRSGSGISDLADTLAINLPMDEGQWRRVRLLVEPAESPSRGRSEARGV